MDKKYFFLPGLISMLSLGAAVPCSASSEEDLQDPSPRPSLGPSLAFSHLSQCLQEGGPLPLSSSSSMRFRPKAAELPLGRRPKDTSPREDSLKSPVPQLALNTLSQARGPNTGGSSTPSTPSQGSSQRTQPSPTKGESSLVIPVLALESVMPVLSSSNSAPPLHPREFDPFIPALPLTQYTSSSSSSSSAVLPSPGHLAPASSQRLLPLEEATFLVAMMNFCDRQFWAALDHHNSILFRANVDARKSLASYEAFKKCPYDLYLTQARQNKRQAVVTDAPLLLSACLAISKNTHGCITQYTQLLQQKERTTVTDAFEAKKGFPLGGVDATTRLLKKVHGFFVDHGARLLHFYTAVLSVAPEEVLRAFEEEVAFYPQYFGAPMTLASTQRTYLEAANWFTPLIGAYEAYFAQRLAQEPEYLQEKQSRQTRDLHEKQAQEREELQKRLTQEALSHGWEVSQMTPRSSETIAHKESSGHFLSFLLPSTSPRGHSKVSHAPRKSSDPESKRTPRPGDEKSSILPFRRPSLTGSHGNSSSNLQAGFVKKGSKTELTSSQPNLEPVSSSSSSTSFSSNPALDLRPRADLSTHVGSEALESYRSFQNMSALDADPTTREQDDELLDMSSALRDLRPRIFERDPALGEEQVTPSSIPLNPKKKKNRFGTLFSKKK